MGTLYVVATPIGNLQDLSPRAQDTLRQVDLIAAEDTRHSRHLLNHFYITTSLYPLHEHNEKQAAQYLLQQLQGGKNLALVSDAGTPLISDPGMHLLQLMHENQLPVIAIPGPSAVITALSVSGLPADQFVFEGFLPAKSTTRQKRLSQLISETRTLVFYEAPHRILDCLLDMSQIFGEERIIVLVKELTKVFETVHRADLNSATAWLQEKAERQKGEFVLIVAGAQPLDNQQIDPDTQKIFQTLKQHLPLKQAAKLTSEITGVSKNILYQFGLQPD